MHVEDLGAGRSCRLELSCPVRPRDADRQHLRRRAHQPAVAVVQAEVLEEVAQAVMRRAAGDDGPGLAAPAQHAFGGEVAQGAPHRTHGHAEHGRQRHLARQHRARRPLADQDRFRHPPLHRLVQRRAGRLRRSRAKAGPGVQPPPSAFCR